MASNRAKARKAASHVIAAFNSDGPPITTLDAFIGAYCEAYEESKSDAIVEFCEKYLNDFEDTIKSTYEEAIENSYPLNFEILGSTDLFIRGIGYIHGSMGPNEIEIRTRRSTWLRNLDKIHKLDPKEFEELMEHFLVFLGSSEFEITSTSRDDGIDFIGKLDLEKITKKNTGLFSLERNFYAYIVGQAKHYKNAKFKISELREIIGSVEMVRSGISAYEFNRIDRYGIKPFDPIFTVFVTSGSVSRYGWSFAKNSGITLVDGRTLALFLTDNGYFD